MTGKSVDLPVEPVDLGGQAHDDLVEVLDIPRQDGERSVVVEGAAGPDVLPYARLSKSAHKALLDLLLQLSRLSHGSTD